MILKTVGTTRLVLIIGGYALKIARHHRGRRCNRFEARIWAEATPEVKAIWVRVEAAYREPSSSVESGNPANSASARLVQSKAALKEREG